MKNKATKLLVLAIGDEYRASSRLRTWQNIDIWKKSNLDVRIDHYNIATPVYKKYKRLGTVANQFRKVLKMPIWIIRALKSDVILFQEVVFLNVWIKLFKAAGKRIIVDFSDPIDEIEGDVGFLKKYFRLFWVRNFKKLCTLADHIIVENEIYASKGFIDNNKLTVFPGPINCEVFIPKGKKLNEELIIGWTGSPGTVSFILPVVRLLDKLARDYTFKLVLVGVNNIDYRPENLSIEFVKWTQETEAHIVSTFDLGLFRLPDNESAIYRGGGKLFVYLASGVPFIATYKGIGKQIIDQSGVGFAVAMESQWQEMLKLAIEEKEKRDLYRLEGRIFAENFLAHTAYSKIIIKKVNAKYDRTEA